MKNFFLSFLLGIFFFSEFLFGQVNDERLVLGIYTRAVADVGELARTRPPKIGVVYFAKDPGCELGFAVNDVITHLDREVIKTPADLKAMVEGLDPEKKHRLTFQRFNGKWVKGEVDFNPKTYREFVNDNLRKTSDKVTGKTHLIDKRSPASPEVTSIQCWIEEENGIDHLVVRYSYHGSEWLFLQEALVKIDDQSVVVKFDQVKRDNDSKVWEWCTREATLDDQELLLRIALAKDVTIRFIGKQYKHDHELTVNDQRAIQNVLEALRMRRQKNK